MSRAASIEALKAQVAMYSRQQVELVNRNTRLRLALEKISGDVAALKRIGELEAENAKLREENIALGGASTMMACVGCNRGVRPRYAVKGMCAECARARIAELEAMNT